VTSGIGTGGSDGIDAWPVGHGALTCQPARQCAFGGSYARSVAAKGASGKDRRSRLADGAGLSLDAKRRDLSVTIDLYP
jgi:hypothetical protein